MHSGFNLLRKDVISMNNDDTTVVGGSGGQPYITQLGGGRGYGFDGLGAAAVLGFFLLANQDRQRDAVAAFAVASAERSGATQLQICQGNKELALQMAQCCCNIEKQITADGNATRALITANLQAAQAAQIAFLQAQLLAAGITPSGVRAT